MNGDYHLILHVEVPEGMKFQDVIQAAYRAAISTGLEIAFFWNDDILLKVNEYTDIVKLLGHADPLEKKTYEGLKE